MKPIDPKAIRAENRALRELVRHMWVHNGYLANGYWQMTTPQKRLYRKLTGGTERDFERAKTEYDRTRKGVTIPWNRQ